MPAEAEPEGLAMLRSTGAAAAQAALPALL